MRFGLALSAQLHHPAQLPPPPNFLHPLILIHFLSLLLIHLLVSFSQLALPLANNSGGKVWLGTITGNRKIWMPKPTYVKQNRKSLLCLFVCLFDWLLDRSLMTGWSEQSWNPERVSLVFTFVSVCLFVYICVCTRATEHTFKKCNTGSCQHYVALYLPLSLILKKYISTDTRGKWKGTIWYWHSYTICLYIHKC